MTRDWSSEQEEKEEKREKDMLQALYERFPFIVIWERVKGGQPYYRTALLLQAALDNAPRTAIYNREEWYTVEDITSEAVRNYFRMSYPELLEEFKVSWR